MAPRSSTIFALHTWHRASVAAVLAGFCQLAPAQVSDGEGLTPLEGVVAISDDRALWDAVKDSRDVNELQAYLAQFPKGLFANVAAIRIRALERAGAVSAPVVVPLAPSPSRAGQTIKDCADCPEMVVLPAGSFEMGSNENADERPLHRVNVPSFLIGKTEVTQGQWRAVMGSNPSSFGSCGDDCPVERVSWDDAQDFAKRLSQKTGRQYRLPSEVEWEYAARAGSGSKWSFGDSEYPGDYAWFSANNQGKTQRVAQKRPNAFGLFDMHGNVWEWVQDCWHDNYSGAPTDGSAWTTGCSSSSRVLRGGSWGYDPAGLRSAIRSRNAPDLRGSVNGLRLARTLLTATLPLAPITPPAPPGPPPPNPAPTPPLAPLAQPVITNPSGSGNSQQAAGPSGSYAGRVRAKLKPNIVLLEETRAQISGNPEAEVEVKASADGSITERKLIKSSGVKSWDDAVLRAIDVTETLPRDIDGRVPPRLVLSFRPKD